MKNNAEIALHGQLLEYLEQPSPSNEHCFARRLLPSFPFTFLREFVYMALPADSTNKSVLSRCTYRITSRTLPPAPL